MNLDYEVTTPCREWQGLRHEFGYGRRPKRHLKSTTLHRQIMEMVHGSEAIKGKVVMHLCDNPPCFRYDHLRIGTYADNNQDMAAKGRWVGNTGKRKTHCKHGHEFTEENTGTKSDGSQRCLACHRNWMRDYYQRKRDTTL